MTQPKKVAQSLMNILIHPVVMDTLNRTSDITNSMNEALSWWDYDLLSRRPSPAYNEDGIFTGTDLDMACFLYALAERDAVINLPVYKSMGKSKTRTDEALTSKADRHGKIIGIGANKNFFSFNIKILDQNVVGQDYVGAPRTFSLTDYTGSWHKGWKEIQFVPTMKENGFITENKLWSGYKIIFTNFVHPNRWTSFFGKYYVISKLMIERLEDEAKYYNAVMKQMKEAGIKFPYEEGPESHEYEYGDSKQMKFNAYEAEIFIPECEITGEYSKIEFNQANLVATYEKRKILNKAISKLRFMTRATEYAHYVNPRAMPAWLQNVMWEEGFVKPKGRTKWRRLKLFQPAVGVQSVSILERQYEKAQTVSADAY